MTTDTALTFDRTYKLYSVRWTIEVFFKESKQYLGLGKCQAQDFDQQIARVSIGMIQYSLFSVAKRFKDYESFGAIFRNSQRDTLELTIAERIWLIIREIISCLTELFEIDAEALMDKLFSENQKNTKFINCEALLNARLRACES